MRLTNDCLAQSLFLSRADSGAFGVPERVSPGRETNGLDSGTSRAIRLISRISRLGVHLVRERSERKKNFRHPPCGGVSELENNPYWGVVRSQKHIL